MRNEPLPGKKAAFYTRPEKMGDDSIIIESAVEVELLHKSCVPVCSPPMLLVAI